MCPKSCIVCLQACNLVEQAIEFMDDTEKKDRVNFTVPSVSYLVLISVYIIVILAFPGA